MPLALLTGCPGDDSGSDDTTTTTTTTGETETNDTTVTPGTDTDEPGETDTDEPGTTEDPDSSTTEGPGEESRVRVMHLGVNAPGVDVYANGDGPVFDGLEFRNSTAYASVPSATYTFDVTVTGTPIEDAVLSPELTLDPDTAYTAVAIGDLNMTDGAPGLDVIALVDDAAGIDAANVRITVIHAAPAVGQVDVWEITGDPIPLVENVDYSGFTTLADIPAGPLEIGIDVDDDAMPDVTFSADLTPLAGQQINVYANNDDTGAVALVAQLGDGTVLTIPAN
ncbi:MAG: DUF4397 domain-containing protein [Nannocystaceae bacterium]